MSAIETVRALQCALHCMPLLRGQWSAFGVAMHCHDGQWSAFGVAMHCHDEMHSMARDMHCIE